MTYACRMKPETSARLFLALLILVIFMQVLIGVAMIAVDQPEIPVGQQYFDAAWYLGSALLLIIALTILNRSRITLGEAMQESFFMIGLIVLIGGFAIDFWPISAVGAVLFIAGLWRVAGSGRQE
jgi:heme A synthase